MLTPRSPSARQHLPRAPGLSSIVTVSSCAVAIIEGNCTRHRSAVAEISADESPTQAFGGLEWVPGYILCDRELINQQAQQPLTLGLPPPEEDQIPNSRHTGYRRVRTSFRLAMRVRSQSLCSCSFRQREGLFPYRE